MAASASGAGTGHVSNVDMPGADTEYSFAIPKGARGFTIKLRGSNDLLLNIGKVAGLSGVTYITIPSGESYSPNTQLYTKNGETLYFQSSASSQVAEISYWM